MSGADRTGGRSIAVSILLLVVAAAAAATLVLFAVTFNGPPPMPAPQTYTNIVTALKTGRAQGGAGRPLQVIERADPPEARGSDHVDPRAAMRLAQLLGARPANVVALMPPGHGDVPDEVRGPFQVGWRHDGGWRVVETRPDRLFTPWHRVTLTAMLLDRKSVV